jgi:predicted nucleic acid-binding protein
LDLDESDAADASILIDTGPVAALLYESDQHHETCVECISRITASLLTCWPVSTEAAWLLRSWPDAISRLMSSFGGKPFVLAPLTEMDLAGVSAILKRYKTLKLQLADAALTHLANREEIDTIFTLDRRDFSVIRAAGGRKFRLIP